MKTMLIPAVCLITALGACTPASQKNPVSRLPDDAAKSSFTYKGESFLRGVKGSHRTSPKGRKAAILDVTYQVACLSGTNPSAKSRFKSARTILAKEFVIAPLYFNNPRERGAWGRTASRRIVEKTGCQITGLNFEQKTTDPLKVLTWALDNKVLGKKP